MALTCDDPQPESGKGLHTQESGDAGFSADMKHFFRINYQDNIAGCGLPVAQKGSSVRPMFHEAEISELTREEMLHPLAFESEHHVSAGEEVADLRKRKQTSPDLEEQQFQGKMDGGVEEVLAQCFPRQKAREKIQKQHQWVPGRSRTTNHLSRKMKWKSSINVCCCILAMTLVVSEASHVNLEPTSGLKNDEASTNGRTCFTCMDEARCPNLTTIYGENDVLFYNRLTTEEIPECSGAPPITQKCYVCWSQSDVNIYCPNNTRTLEAEDCNGSRITNIIKGCDQQQKSYLAPNGSANKASYAHLLTGPLCSIVVVLMML